MVKRSNSFARALKDAEKRLEKAQAERTAAQVRVMELSLEIPHLQQIIASLSRKVVMPIEARTAGFKGTTAVTGEHRAETSADLPADLAALVGPQDLSGMGSIPPRLPTEDELLPDDFAEGKKK